MCVFPHPVQPVTWTTAGLQTRTNVRGSYVKSVLLNMHYTHTLTHWPGPQAHSQPANASSGTLIFGLGPGQILQVGLDQVGQLGHDFGPLRGAALRPLWEGSFSCRHRRLHLHTPEVITDLVLRTCTSASVFQTVLIPCSNFCYPQADLDLTACLKLASHQ